MYFNVYYNDFVYLNLTIVYMLKIVDIFNIFLKIFCACEAERIIQNLVLAEKKFWSSLVGYGRMWSGLVGSCRAWSLVLLGYMSA